MDLKVAELPDDWTMQVHRAYSMFGTDLGGANEFGRWSHLIDALTPEMRSALARRRRRDQEGQFLREARAERGLRIAARTREPQEAEGLSKAPPEAPLKELPKALPGPYSRGLVDSKITVEQVEQGTFPISPTALKDARKKVKEKGRPQHVGVVFLDSAALQETMGPAGTPFMITFPEAYDTPEEALAGVSGFGSGIVGVVEVGEDSLDLEVHQTEPIAVRHAREIAERNERMRREGLLHPGRDRLWEPDRRRRRASRRPPL